MKWLILLSLISFQTLAQDPSKLPNGEPRTPVSDEVSPMNSEPAVPATPAAAEKPITEEVKEAAEEVKKEVSNTAGYRENSRGTALVGFEAISTWVPLKFTGSYTHIFNKKWSLEGEFGRGKSGAGALGFDVASITEYRYSLLGRRYIGNSFNWILGLYKDDLKIKLGSDIVDSLSGASSDELRIDVIGATLGLGNRWQWQNGFTLGMDWFRLNLPVIKNTDDGVIDRITSNSDQNAVERGLKRVANIPTVTLFGLYLGYTF